MKEIELKVLEVNKQKIITKLVKLGAKRVFLGEVVSKVYDFEDQKLKKEKSFVRLRKLDKEILVTFKTKIENSKVCMNKEIEFNVDCMESMEEFLSLLNMKVFSNYSKNRESYILNGVKFEFDKISNIPEFMEIEANSIEKIEEYIEILGIDKSKIKRWNGLEVLNFYKEKAL